MTPAARQLYCAQLLVLAACYHDTGPLGLTHPPPPVASVTVAPGVDTLTVGGTRQLTTTIRDVNGDLQVSRVVTWASSDPQVATVSTKGKVAAVAPGSATITATSEGKSGAAVVAIGPPVALVTVTPGTDTVVIGGTTQLTATAWDAQGQVVTVRVVTWTTNKPAVATVSASGQVDAVLGGFANITATSGGRSGSATVLVPVVFTALSAGDSHTCGLVASGAVYCWGANGSGQLGNGTTTFGAVPAVVSGALKLVQVSAGDRHTCGISAAGAAYCWGLNGFGSLGNGSSKDSKTPVVVSGARTFTTIAEGSERLHTCGLIASGAAYCWGSGSSGQLGNASKPFSSQTPVPVSSGLGFASVRAGGAFACGVTAGGLAHCWGQGGNGQLGIGSFADTSAPAPVSGMLTFTGVAAGFFHSCGLASGGAAYCWGYNADGELGNGSTSDSTLPVAVSGGLTFSALSAGAYHACALTSGGVAYCWGANGDGQLGNGTTADSPTPVMVGGSLTFAALSAGGRHTCGLTTGGVAYCWGANDALQLGIGTAIRSSTPVKVAGQR